MCSPKEQINLKFWSKKMLKNRLVLVILLFLSSAYSHAEEIKSAEPVKLESQKSDPTPIGIWMVHAGDAKVEIYKNGEELEGKIVWLKEPLDEKGNAKLDTKNPDETLRSTPIMNLIFLKGFKKEVDENKWSGGTVYDAKSGKLYKGWIQPLGEKKLKLRGYVGISLFGRSEEWDRQ